MELAPALALALAVLMIDTPDWNQVVYTCWRMPLPNTRAPKTEDNFAWSAFVAPDQSRQSPEQGFFPPSQRVAGRAGPWNRPCGRLAVLPTPVLILVPTHHS
jgi:hypothetical protein